jgi:Ca2+/Na+ antiporter
MSNGDLYRKLTAVKDAGYLQIPNQQIMPSLQEFGPAFFGGLFFTFTVGAGLSVISFAASWMWDRIFSRNRLLLILLFLPWTVCLVFVNYRGLSPMVSAYFFVVPAVVSVFTLKLMPEVDKHRAWLNRIVHFVSITLLALLWASQTGSHMFLDIRDNLLLSNSWGRRVNDFYYTYTLYPAEVFKSLDQKTLKTCNLESIREKSIATSLERALVNYDYLNVGRHGAADLKISQEENKLVFEHKRARILRVTTREFLSGPGRVLKEFSSKSDRETFFRQFTFLSLLVGFPLTMYVVVHGLLCLVLGRLVGLRNAQTVASILCFSVGLLLLIPLYLHRGKEIELKGLAEALESERWQDRIAALKVIQREGIEVSEFPGYQTGLTSPHVPERYWLVRALSVSRLPETYKDLSAFLDDPNSNVVSMAFYALGQRGDRGAIKEIIKRIETSDHWYCQWYAYKALRNLGWKQTAFQQRP